MIDFPNLKNFTKDELSCRCGCGSFYLDYDALVMLQSARDIAGIPFPILSGTRCRSHNRDVGGVSNSMHLIGSAFDIAIDKQNAHLVLRGLILAGFRTFGFYDDFIHVDARNVPTYWIKKCAV